MFKMFSIAIFCLIYPAKQLEQHILCPYFLLVCFFGFFCCCLVDSTWFDQFGLIWFDRVWLSLVSWHVNGLKLVQMLNIPVVLLLTVDVLLDSWPHTETRMCTYGCDMKVVK